MINIKTEILEFLVSKYDKAYTITQITAHLGLKKDNRPEIQKILNELFKDGYIMKISKRYSAIPEKFNLPITNENQETIVINNETNINIEESLLENKPVEKVVGTFDATSLAKNYSYAFVICDEGKDVFISSEDTLNAYHGDTVEVEIQRYRNEKRYGIITKIIERKREKFIGIVDTVRKKQYFKSDNKKIHTMFDVISDKKIEPNFKVVVEIINWGLRQKNKLPVCKVVEVLGEAGNPEVELLAVIRDFDLPLEFPEDVIEEASSFADITEEIKAGNFSAKRLDLRDLYTITIDPASAKDFDDAISIIEEDENLILFVHIADVAHYIKLGSRLFEEAVNRGNSYYFPKKVIPMLPEILSNKLCSLRPDEEKYTITVKTTFDNKGKIKAQEIFETITRSNVRLAYEEVDDYFEGKNTEFTDELISQIELMRKLSKFLSLNRTQRGYLKFDLPEVNYIFDDEGNIANIERSKETESHMLIENFMLIANEYVAKLLTRKTKATIYRIHEEPDERDLNRIKDILKVHEIFFKVEHQLNKTWQNVIEALPDEKYHRVFDRMILRSMKKAKYSTNKVKHFGLGLETYTHFTSPIRRLCDLLVHMQLKQSIFKNSISEPDSNLKLNPEKMFELAGIATERESIADESERSMESKLLINFMKDKLGTKYKALIVHMNSNNIFIELNDIPVRGVIKLNQVKDDYYEFDERYMLIKGKRNGRIYRLCDYLDVILSSVDDDILFIPADNPNSFVNKSRQNKKSFKKNGASNKYKRRKRKK
jgi:ribonuclease R